MFTYSRNSIGFNFVKMNKKITFEELNLIFKSAVVGGWVIMFLYVIGFLKGVWIALP